MPNTDTLPVADSASHARFMQAWARVARLRRSGWTVRVWDVDAERGRLLVDGLEPGGTFEQGYGFRGSIDRHGNLTAEPAVAGDD